MDDILDEEIACKLEISPSSESLLEVEVQKLQGEQVVKFYGVVIGTLVDHYNNQVDFPGNPTSKPLTAISTRVFSKNECGRDVALAFVGGDPMQPVLLGIIESPYNKVKSLQVELDKKKLALSADNEIVLRCGKASITLSSSGKILLRGTYIVSRSSGLNHIKGGSVQLN